MVKSGRSKRRSRHSGGPAGRKSQNILMPDAVDATDSRKRHLDIIIAVLLLGFGIYQSVQFWGLAPMPHPDSPYFIRVTWDSRIGTATRNSYYKKWHIEKIRMLIESRSLMLMESDPLRPGRPRPVAYYKFLTRVGNRYRYINIFRLYEPADAPERPVRYCLYDKDKDTISNVRE